MYAQHLPDSLDTGETISSFLRFGIVKAGGIEKEDKFHALDVISREAANAEKVPSYGRVRTTPQVAALCCLGGSQSVFFLRLGVTNH